MSTCLPVEDDASVLKKLLAEMDLVFSIFCEQLVDVFDLVGSDTFLFVNQVDVDFLPFHIGFLNHRNCYVCLGEDLEDFLKPFGFSFHPQIFQSF